MVIRYDKTLLGEVTDSETDAGETVVLTLGNPTYASLGSASTHTVTLGDGVITRSPGEVWKDPLTGIEFVWVPGGTFQMGCGSWTSSCDSDESPVHTVRLDGFWLGRYEVTQGQWSSVMESNPSRFKSGNDYPVEWVSWTDVQGYLGKLNASGDGKYRLPTEAEWEYACRSGGREENYSGGGLVGDVGWYQDNFGSGTHLVGTKSANGLGLYDMSGNVWEWVQDWYTGYRSEAQENPIYDSSGSSRVGRGGSWNYDARGLRCANRYGYDPGDRNNYLGFRLARTP